MLLTAGQRHEKSRQSNTVARLEELPNIGKEAFALYEMVRKSFG